MKCNKCTKEFLEKDIEESHKIPLYLFDGFTRPERKQQADKHGREWLCHQCHDHYEASILQLLYLNLLRVNIDLVLNRAARRPYKPKIWRLPTKKKQSAIKMIKKVYNYE